MPKAVSPSHLKQFSALEMGAKQEKAA